ncbi:MAG: PQQ-binding-like beta-propeller repeat protein [Chitinivibrionales bacterium]|nr:PQQ-binding-like beta-propeller repeat protein [Chitinivibrionales bacterium]
MVQDWYAQSRSVFALDRATGETRWVYRSPRCVSNQSLALGEERLYIAEGPPYGFFASVLGDDKDTTVSLAALDLTDGSVVWRTPRFARLARSDAPDVQFVEGLVLVDGVAAYDASSGERRWQREEPVEAAGEAVVLGEWVVVGRHAYALDDGARRTVPDPITGGSRPWEYARSYGCGPVAGCRTMMVFRSGAVGMYDVGRGGTTTFGGVRAGCAVNLVPANGLINAPEAVSGCVCSYNYQTSFALVPAERRTEEWYVFGGTTADGPVKQLCLNLGAPGDRRDSNGVPWLAVPHPVARGSLPVPATVSTRRDELVWCHRAANENSKGASRSWLYGAGLADSSASVVVQLQPPREVVVSATDNVPTVDGILDDVCWHNTKEVPFSHHSHLAKPGVVFYAKRDSANLYFAYRREASVVGGRPVPFEAGEMGTDVRWWVDDGIKVVIGDNNRKAAVCLGVFAGGGTVDGRIDLVKGGNADTKWNGEWSHAAAVDANQLRVEMAVPLATLKKVGIDPASLALNVCSQNKSGVGASEIVLLPYDARYFDGCTQLLPMVAQEPRAQERPYTLRLHVAAPAGPAGEGDRALTAVLQNGVVSERIDVGSGGTVVKEIRGVKAGRELRVDLAPVAGVRPAMLCALEVHAE